MVGKRVLLHGYQLSPINQLERDSYIGSVPRQLEQEMGLSSRQVFALLDQMADEHRMRKTLPINHRYTISGHDGGVAVEDVHWWRRYATVYFIGMGQRRYVLKITDSPEQAYNEAAVGLYFTHRPTRDLSRLIAANPEKCWLLMEHIDVHSSHPENRPGKTLAEQGFEFADDLSNHTLEEPHTNANRINGIRVDYGYGQWKDGPPTWMKKCIEQLEAITGKKPVSPDEAAARLKAVVRCLRLFYQAGG